MTKLTTTNTLNARQRAFVFEYLKDRIATRAAIRAGYSMHTARAMGSENLTKPAIRREIDRADGELLARIRSRTGIDLEKTVVGLARVAFADPRKLFDPSGAPLPIHELDDDTALAIESIEVVETYEGSGEERTLTGYVKKYRFSRRGEAQDKLMKHLGGYKEHEQQGGAAAGNAIVALLEGMRRSTLPVVEHVDSDHGV